MTTRRYSVPGMLFQGLFNSIGKCVAFVVLALQIARERRQLLNLGDEQRRDMGIGRGAASQESERGFFDIPENRLKRGQSSHGASRHNHNVHRTVATKFR